MYLFGNVRRKVHIVRPWIFIKIYGFHTFRWPHFSVIFSLFSLVYCITKVDASAPNTTSVCECVVCKRAQHSRIFVSIYYTVVFASILLFSLFLRGVAIFMLEHRDLA